MKRTLITGGAGFIGCHTAMLMTNKGHQVAVLDNFSTGKTENLKGCRAEIMLADITDLHLLERAFADFRPQAVMHLAAQSAISVSERDPQKDLTINAIGTINVVDMARKYEVDRFVFSSTSAVYNEDKWRWFPRDEKFPKDPQSPYGISKLAAEHYVRTMFPNHVIFRYGNVYGPFQRSIGENQVVARALAHFHHGDDFHVVGHGNQKRDFVFVEDVAYGNTEAVLGKMVGTYNLCTGKSKSVNQILAEIENTYEVGGYRWNHSKKQDPRGDVHLSARKFKSDFCMMFTPLDVGMRKTASWWRAQK